MFKAALLFCIFSIALVILTVSEPVVADSRWSIYTTMSMIDEGDIDLDEYGPMLEQNGYYMTDRIDGHYYSQFPVGVSVLVLPVVFIYDAFNDLGDNIRTMLPSETELFLASMIVAATAVFIFLIARRQGLGLAGSLGLTGIFTFGTSAWSTASLSLWQHGPSMLMLAIALYLILGARERPSLIQFVSLPLAFSYVIRPTNAIAVTLLTLYVAMEYRRYLVRFVLWGMLLAIPFFAFNYSVYGSITSPYYSADRLIGRNPGTIVSALAGNLVSPARGLFIFSPVLLLAIIGIVMKIRKRQFKRLDYILAAIVLLHWLAISLVTQWWGGHSFGPRFFTDMLPFLVYFMIPVFLELGALDAWRKPAAVGVVSLLAVFSVFVHFRGSTCSEVQDWNVVPEISDNRWRLWYWSDIPYLSGIEDNLFTWKENCFAPDVPRPVNAPPLR
ncbi:MAG: hypothetical protein ACYC5A_08155 [Thermoleophilia bacterium]